MPPWSYSQQEMAPRHVHDRAVRAPGKPLISVIIPAVDEAATLGATIASVRSGAMSFEIIVVDAQSSDETSAVALAAGARVVPCVRRQRAHQMNLGAQNARGEILLFVHADTLLPSCALDQIAEQTRDRKIAGGAFVRRYASPSRLLRMTCFLAQCRNRVIGWHLGDQAMFARRGAFVRLGGFRDVDLFEDMDFSRRLKRLGRVVTLRPGVTTSARRFARGGAARTTLRDFALTLRYLFAGVEKAPPATPPFLPLYDVAKNAGKI